MRRGVVALPGGRTRLDHGCRRGRGTAVAGVARRRKSCHPLCRVAPRWCSSSGSPPPCSQAAAAPARRARRPGRSSSAWARGDVPAAAAATDDPAAATAALQQVDRELGLGAGTLAVGDVAGDGTVAYTASWVLAGVVEPWRYDGRVATVEAPDGTWRVRWQPQDLHPRLGPGQSLELTRELPPRAAITAGDGTPLVSATPTVTVGIVPARTPDLPGVAAQLAAALRIDAADIVADAARAQPGDFVTVITLAPTRLRGRPRPDPRPARYRVPRGRRPARAGAALRSTAARAGRPTERRRPARGRARLHRHRRHRHRRAAAGVQRPARRHGDGLDRRRRPRRPSRRAVGHLPRAAGEPGTHHARRPGAAGRRDGADRGRPDRGDRRRAALGRRAPGRRELHRGAVRRRAGRALPAGVHVQDRDRRGGAAGRTRAADTPVACPGRRRSAGA